jgi:hypothetical protein
VVLPKLPRCPTFGDLRSTANQDMCQDPRIQHLGVPSQFRKVEISLSSVTQQVHGQHHSITVHVIPVFISAITLKRSRTPTYIRSKYDSPEVVSGGHMSAPMDL